MNIPANFAQLNIHTIKMSLIAGFSQSSTKPFFATKEALENARFNDLA